MTTTLTNVKLGKKAPRFDERTLHLADYLDIDVLPKIPASVDWGSKVSNWGMLGNNTIGDCTTAGALHQIMAWESNVSNEFIPSDNDAIAAYSAITGYDPATGANDNGAVEIDVLNYWRQTGIAQHKIDAYVALEPKNHDHIKASVYLFGGCYIGLALPLSAQNQSIWSVPFWGTHGNGAPGSWGGHCVCVTSYDKHYLTCITWGMTKKMTWGFWDHYCDESYAILSRDFINAQNIAPNSIDWSSLQQDLNNVSH